MMSKTISFTRVSLAEHPITGTDPTHHPSTYGRSSLTVLAAERGTENYRPKIRLWTGQHDPRKRFKLSEEAVLLYSAACRLAEPAQKRSI